MSSILTEVFGGISVASAPGFGRDVTRDDPNVTLPALLKLLDLGGRDMFYMQTALDVGSESADLPLQMWRLGATVAAVHPSPDVTKSNRATIAAMAGDVPFSGLLGLFFCEHDVSELFPFPPSSDRWDIITRLGSVYDGKGDSGKFLGEAFSHADAVAILDKAEGNAHLFARAPFTAQRAMVEDGVDLVYFKRNKRGR